jgi:hypothetical protein
VRNYIQELLASIHEDYERGEMDYEELEAKSLFRLLNYCPPEFPEKPKQRD